MALVSLAVIGVSLTTLARSVIADSVVEGARFAALADQSSADGCVRARELIGEALGNFMSLELQCASGSVGGRSFEAIRAEAEVLGLTALLPFTRLVVEAKASNELQR